MINEAKLDHLIGQMLSDLGGASSVVMRLGFTRRFMPREL